jgi:K+-transporting ATPase ATPase A chain
MTSIGLGQMVALLALLVLVAKPLGAYMAAVFEGKRTFASRLVLPLERLIYRVTRIHPENDQL